MKGTAGRLICLIALIFLLNPGAMSQQPRSAWYGEAGAGVHLLSDLDLSGGRQVESDQGWMVSGAVGRVLGRFRAEGELLYSENEFDKVSIAGSSATLGGNFSTFGGMGNLYFDFDTNSPFRPFVGGGVGVVLASMNDALGGGLLSADDDDSVFAYQLKAGFSYEFTPLTALIFNYRFLTSEDMNFRDTSGAAFSADGLQSHSIEARIRFRF